MTTLLLAEHDNKTLKDSTHKALTAAKALGQPVHVLVAGKGCRPVAEAAAKLDGVQKVLLADGAAYEHMLAEPLAALVVSLAPSYDAVVAPATTTGKNVMPRVAALLDVMQISDIVKVIAPDTFERLIYAGNAIQSVRSKDKTKVITVRTSTFQATGEGGSAPIEDAASAADPGISSFVGEELSKSERPELSSAKIIISGGRAMQSRDNFTKYIEPVADRLASRPDRQDRGAAAVHRRGHLGRDPASGGHEGLEGDRGHQQGRGGADLPGRRLRARCRSLPGAAGIGGGTGQARPLTMTGGCGHGRVVSGPGSS